MLSRRTDNWQHLATAPASIQTMCGRETLPAAFSGTMEGYLLRVKFAQPREQPDTNRTTGKKNAARHRPTCATSATC